MNTMLVLATLIGAPIGVLTLLVTVGPKQAQQKLGEWVSVTPVGKWLALERRVKAARDKRYFDAPRRQIKLLDDMLDHYRKARR